MAPFGGQGLLVLIREAEGNAPLMQLNLCPSTATFQRARKGYYCQELCSEGGLSLFLVREDEKPMAR
jgi:hypothetical protein